MKSAGSAELAPLKSLVTKIQGGGTPTASRPEFYHGEVPFLKIDDLTASTKYVAQAKKHISERGLHDSSAWIVPPNALLYSIYATLGEVRILKVPAATNQAILGIVVDESKANIEYLYYFLLSIKDSITGMAKQGTQKNLTKAIIEDIQVRLPPLKEQKRIAGLISQVDEVIALDCQVIDSAISLRSGLMDRLFHFGAEQADVKQTELGPLPSNWTVELLDNVAKRGSGHTPDKKIVAYYQGEIKWVSLADTNKLDHGLISDTAIKISSAGIANSSAVVHKAGSVLLSRDAGVGKSSIMSEDMAVSQHFMVWSCGERLHNWYLYYYLQYRKAEFERIAVGSTIKTIGLPFFKALTVPVPPLDEQIRIAGALRSVDEMIYANLRSKRQYAKLKDGLMADLLSTGSRK